MKEQKGGQSDLRVKRKEDAVEVGKPRPGKASQAMEGVKTPFLVK